MRENSRRTTGVWKSINGNIYLSIERIGMYNGDMCLKILPMNKENVDYLYDKKYDSIKFKIYSPTNQIYFLKDIYMTQYTENELRNTEILHKYIIGHDVDRLSKEYHLSVIGIYKILANLSTRVINRLKIGLDHPGYLDLETLKPPELEKFKADIGTRTINTLARYIPELSDAFNVKEYISILQDVSQKSSISSIRNMGEKALKRIENAIVKYSPDTDPDFIYR